MKETEINYAMFGQLNSHLTELVKDNKKVLPVRIDFKVGKDSELDDLVIINGVAKVMKGLSELPEVVGWATVLEEDFNKNLGVRSIIYVSDKEDHFIYRDEAIKLWKEFVDLNGEVYCSNDDQEKYINDGTYCLDVIVDGSTEQLNKLNHILSHMAKIEGKLEKDVCRYVRSYTKRKDSEVSVKSETAKKPE